jgi:hypothetical protein
VSFENLGLTYQREQSFGAAFSFFEEANKKFFDKPYVNLMLHSFNALKGDKKHEVCLQIAEQMCSLSPENMQHWYVLASALHKTVLLQLRAARDKVIRVASVQRWIRELERCVQLFEVCQKAFPRKAAAGIPEKIDSIRNHLLRKFRGQYLTQAIDYERKKDE